MVNVVSRKHRRLAFDKNLKVKRICYFFHKTRVRVDFNIKWPQEMDNKHTVC